jgi:membrane protein DedA with SNARE-associated domain
VIAGTTHELNIALVIAAAIGGAILGDNVGYWIGREFGYRMLLRSGLYLRLTGQRLKLGQYLFLRYGGVVVFFGRFTALLLALAAFMAGANRMRLRSFLLFNAAGACVWATLYGTAAYYLEKEISMLAGPVGIGTGMIAVFALAAAGIFLRRHEADLQASAEKALPGRLRLVPKSAGRGGADCPLDAWATNS